MLNTSIININKCYPYPLPWNHKGTNCKIIIHEQLKKKIGIYPKHLQKGLVTKAHKANNTLIGKKV